MRLGFDVDEVVADILTPTLKFINECKGTKFKLADIKDYKMTGILEDTKQFYQLFGREILNSAKPLQHSDRYLRKLYKNGHSIHLVSSRNHHVDALQDLADWVYKYKIPADTIMCHAENKGAIAKQLGLEFFVDDAIDNMESLKSANIPAVIFDKPYNRQYIGKRVMNWKDLYKKLAQ